MVHDLPVRRGVVAYLGPAAVASLVPGPSDFPVRYRMLTSWGYSLGDATLAVAAGGVFNIGIKLVLPVIAAVGLLVSDAPVDGTLRTIVAVALLIGIGMAGVAVVLASERADAADRARARPDLAGCAASPAPARRRRPRRAARREQGPRPGDAPQPLADRLVGHVPDRPHPLRAAAARRARNGSPTRCSAGRRCSSPTPSSRASPSSRSRRERRRERGGLVSLLTASAGEGSINEVTAAVILFRLLTWLLSSRSASGRWPSGDGLSVGTRSTVPGDDRATSTAPRQDHRTRGAGRRARCGRGLFRRR